MFKNRFIKNTSWIVFGQIFQMMQFFYFCNVMYDIKELKECFEQMFEDGKTNSQILAKLLIENYEEPSYISSKNIPISGIYFEYYKGIKNILNYALEIKEKSIISCKIALKIINHTYESTIPPIRFGRKNTVLNMFVPLIPFVSAIAMINDTTLMIHTDTTVNKAVYHIECKNDVSRVPFTTKIFV